jgi:ABC transporter substrate binding protein
MRKGFFGFTLCAILFTLCSTAQAQQATKIPRVGYLAGGGSAPHPALIQALRELGYVEGKNIAIEFRSREGKPERERKLAQELVQSKVDIIIADGTAQARAAKEATSTIPIVMAGTTDPVGTGLVASLARPGGNVTGLSSISGDLGGKLLELLKEIVPKLSRVLVPGATPGSPPQDVFIKEMELPARVLFKSTGHKTRRTRTRRLRKYLSSCDQGKGSGFGRAHSALHAIRTAQTIRGVSQQASAAGYLSSKQLDRIRRSHLIRRGSQFPVPTRGGLC